MLIYVWCVDFADGPPTFLVRPEAASVPDGSALVLFCRAAGDPPPSIMWLLNGHTIAESRYVSLFQSFRCCSALHFQSAFQDSQNPIFDEYCNILWPYRTLIGFLVFFWTFGFKVTRRMWMQGMLYFHLFLVKQLAV